MKRLLAAMLTLPIMGLLLWSGLRRSPSTSVTPEAPALQEEDRHPAEATIRALLQSGDRGDVPAYLDAFAGALRARLERSVDERGRQAFADDLRRAASARKSHAVFGAEGEESGSARVAVESVYPDRNERQTYRLEPLEGTWRVVEVESVRSHQPLARFGAPAVYIAPEGVPVQDDLAVETGDDRDAPVTPGP